MLVNVRFGFVSSWRIFGFHALYRGLRRWGTSVGTVASNAYVSAATTSWAPLRLRTIEKPGTESVKPPVERRTCATP